jgi:hypothetical protein
MRGRFSRAEVGFLIGMPLLWAILLLFHPGGDGDGLALFVAAVVLYLRSQPREVPVTPRPRPVAVPG